MHFAIDETAAAILSAGVLFITLCKIFLFPHSSLPSLSFSRLKDLQTLSWRSKWAKLPQQLHSVALLSLMIAFLDPHVLIPKTSQTQHSSSQKLPTEGIAIYLVLDQSGSMQASVQATGGDGKEKIPKINLLKQVTKQFILDHPTDLIGLVSFARTPQVLVPLTLDDATLIKKLEAIRVVSKPDEDGTAIGYAIYKTATLLAATRQFSDDLKLKGNSPYTIKSAAIILVTDGFQDPNLLDKGNRLRTMELDDAAAYAKSEHIRLYVVNIDPILSTAQYAPQRRQLQKITALTGGQFYMVSDAQGLHDIYASIDKLEKGSITQTVIGQQPLKSQMSRVSLYPFFLILGMCALFLSLGLDSSLLRRIP